MLNKDNLIYKINNKTATVGIVGLGYVGLPLAVEFAKGGYKVLGFDIQEKKVNMINNGENYISDVMNEELKFVIENRRLKASNEIKFLKDTDVILICVPTPLDKYQQPDISYVKESTESVGKYLHEGMLVILESTTYPGTTEELVLPTLEKMSGLKCEKDFYLAFSPERVDPGNSIYHTANTAKVVGGVGRNSTEIAATLYRNVLNSEIFEVSTPRVAEMEKILENTYRNINIGLINEMAVICNKMNINIWEVIEAAKTKPYGFQAFYPGPGLGGHCIPLDPYYLTWKAREYDYHTRLIETSGEINNFMPQYIVQRAASILNKFNKALNKANILILGIAYKSDIDDYRESPALKIIENFQKQGSEVEFYDPYISSYMYKGKEHYGIKLTQEVLRNADLVVITTAHKKYNYSFIQENSIFIFDTRNATKNVQNKDNIELL
ncbi:nucleotide sugar dehydrogenase [Clostridium saccharobutylicum]|uniref:UDP-N-acetyl-D-glucosamine 6-dehydrogenase WbpA n=1 Tax=Clostridium saccharobutylicum DSM 13864 TaxID=1345695 RepID=U5MX05_CLOSA|nr:nucleotide sugar dehydrogenase [Clostridium saccharobutylicum]AGX45125.1 UDP-N-acetyl-D-glucosamine 6-dehydrogenase WbpA [Clostridium saccharobutylicum DSM 13864]AQR92405.1 UDP-N-acetyl-D-glucosamine 6-dehydrogenase [Clostridium saccharobutylicum]AQS02308.1 UDP-N-acetyl-D-glucosamine 6-dehydrogenase [Clostridium saccharobutylicum]AQS11912.1 UDP-N-acetyl-D-glucosamine 6-dehydrogenase [Clostridium saccharobutylicum]AQS16291.1 UDP-N-acetyl-D-glucosamine 6-dehydrogenase [Clostridium saccharobut